MVKILVSKCLYGGEIVRYDGGDTTETDPRFLKWKQEGRLIPICPEVFGGLPTPRPDSQRIDSVHVMTQTGQDVTKEYTKGAKEALRLAQSENVAFCIMKQDSPSCGNFYSDMGIYKLFICIEDKEIINDYYEKTIRPITAYDAAIHSDLAKVLRCYLANDCSVKATAEELFVHRNTINYKLGKIEKLLDMDLSSLDHRLQLLVGFMLQDML